MDLTINGLRDALRELRIRQDMTMEIHRHGMQRQVTESLGLPPGTSIAPLPPDGGDNYVLGPDGRIFTRSVSADGTVTTATWGATPSEAPYRYEVEYVAPRFGMSLGFGRESEAPRRPPKRTAVMERPNATPYTLPPTLPPAEYLETAAAIGLNSGPVMEARLDRFFVDRGWLLFDTKAVELYLQNICDRRNEEEAAKHLKLRRADPFGTLWYNPQVVAWVPLRPKDGRLLEVGSESYYDERVPMHALLKVKEMESHFGIECLAFSVSKIQREPDPFLKAQAVGTREYVIDVWDEPGWGV